MICSRQRVVMFLIFFGLLTIQPCRVCGLKRSDLVFTQHGIGSRNQRVLKAVVDMKGINTEKKASAVNNRFDPNQSSKRRFRRGPDPIHNKS
ncbi:hypothetical protein J1N35_042485 [Gossypium stocksii]|uniref:Uncharacterized protein n=1 Tax=Gossypium stocksii TaxID=47602 RepID=A0A9D3UHE0_9ROSI|nr:hypothetical protein J1N35_042485 [Gossypium stocksii]